jgi:hypothetical protein
VTFEKRCLIETSDIVAAQYECGKCHAAVVVPIEQMRPDQFASIAMAACPYCQTPSGFQLGTNDMKVFLEFNSALQQIGRVSAGRNLKLRLNIKCAD